MYELETRTFHHGEKDYQHHSFPTVEAAHAFLQTRNAFGYHDVWVKDSKLDAFKNPTLDELRVMFDKPVIRPFPTNFATHAQVVANAPVAVNCGMSCQLIER